MLSGRTEPDEDLRSMGYRRRPPADRRIVSSAIGASVIASLATFLVAAFSVQIMRDLSWNATGLGLAVATYFGAQTITATTVGAWVDRLGWTRALRIGVILSIVALTSIAAWGSSTIVFVGALAVAGVGTAATVTASNRALAATSASSRRATAFGAKQASVPSAALLAGLSVPLFTQAMGWRWAFGAAALLAAAVWPLVPRRYGVRPTDMSNPAGLSDSSKPVLIWLVLAGTLATAVASGMATFVVASSVEVGISERAAALVFTGGSATVILMRVAAGFYVDRRGDGEIRTFAVMVWIGAVGLVVFTFGVAWLVPVGALLTFAAGWGWPGLLHFAVVSRARSAPGRASGLLQTGLTFGAATGPAFFGLLVDHRSFGAAWLTLAGIAGIAGLAAIRARLVDDRRHQAAKGS